MKLQPYKPIPKHKTDFLTYAVRFVCGFIFGCLAGAMCVSRHVMRGWPALTADRDIDVNIYFILLVVSVGFFIGMLSAIFGDRFWKVFERR